jgi:hypothetical protein
LASDQIFFGKVCEKILLVACSLLPPNIGMSDAVEKRAFAVPNIEAYDPSSGPPEVRLRTYPTHFCRMGWTT